MLRVGPDGAGVREQHGRLASGMITPDTPGAALLRRASGLITPDTPACPPVIMLFDGWQPGSQGDADGA